LISTGEISALLAAVFWSIAVIIFKSVGNTVSSFVITPAKNFIAIILFFLVCVFTQVPVWYNGLMPSEYFRLILSGCLGMGIADLLFLYSLNKIGANRIAIVNTLEPFAVLLMSFIVLNETIPNPIQSLGFLIISGAVLSIALEKSPKKDIDSKSYYQGILLMVLAISISAFGIVLMKPILFKLGQVSHPDYNSYQLLLWGSMLRLLPGVLITIIILFSKRDWKALLAPAMNKDIGLRLLIASGLGTFFALNFWIIGYAYMEETALTSILGQMSAIFIIILARIFLKETITTIRIISMCLAFIGVVLVVAG
tara:strand:- start:1313 stop:2245 length:933 start_codon:yes stop_codon:yes gene_type:complete